MPQPLMDRPLKKFPARMKLEGSVLPIVHTSTTLHFQPHVSACELYTFLFWPIHATCPYHLIACEWPGKRIMYLFTMHYAQPSVISPCLGPNFFPTWLNIVFSLISDLLQFFFCTRISCPIVSLSYLREFLELAVFEK